MGQAGTANSPNPQQLGGPGEHRSSRLRAAQLRSSTRVSGLTSRQTPAPPPLLLIWREGEIASIRLYESYYRLLPSPRRVPRPLIRQPSAWVQHLNLNRLFKVARRSTTARKPDPRCPNRNLAGPFVIQKHEYYLDNVLCRTRGSN